MIVAYRQLPGSAGGRPFLDVLIGPSNVRVSALVDSGAVHSLFHTDVANACDIDLADAEERSLIFGPLRASATARFTTVQMEFGGFIWEAEVGFTTAISLDWGLLGHSRLFRWFTVTFRAYESEFEIVNIDS